MELCPKMPMLAFELKLCNTESTDFTDRILKYIRIHYQENPDTFVKEIGDLNQLRENTMYASKDFLGLNVIKKYYNQLQFLSNRFPMKQSEPCETEFSWDDLYHEKEIVISDIRYELQCVLYNIGAMHSFLGCIDKRYNDEGIKKTCSHFQYAAWAFQTVRDIYSGLAYTNDLNEDIMSFKMNIMLAQAQECVLEKSIIDNRKHSINSKISTQICDYYRLAITNNEKPEFSSSVGSRLTKDWKNYCLYKINYYTALTSYFASLSSSEQEKYGESLGYIQYAETKLTECVKMKIVFKEFQEPLKYTTDLIEMKSKLIKKDNDFVYNQKIVAVLDLPEIKGVSLVKCLQIDFLNDPEVASQDLFSRLVSIKAHELSSLYSEEKAKLLRQLTSQLDEKNTQLNQFMSALQINQLHLDNFDYLKLPKQLLECCAAISVKPSLLKEDIPKTMISIVNVSVQAKEILDEIEQQIESEDKEHREEKSKNGQSSSESENDSDSDGETEINAKKNSIRNIKLKQISKRYNILYKNYTDANASNQALHEAFNSIIKNLQILSLPLNELSDKLPAIEQINDEESKQIRDKLVSLLAKVEEMKTQREQLFKRLQAALQDDDLTKLIASKQNDITNTSEFFAEQLKKHDQLQVYLQQNLQAQDNILRALAESNASFASDRKKILDATQQRNSFIDSLVFSYDSIGDLCEKANKGVIFFHNLKQPLNELLNDVKEFCSKFKQEREARRRIAERVQQITGGGVGIAGGVLGGGAGVIGGGGVVAGKGGGATAAPVFNRYRPQPVPANNINLPNDEIMINNNLNERPKLKDFLPFMKPQSWGNHGSNTGKASTPHVLGQTPTNFIQQQPQQYIQPAQVPFNNANSNLYQNVKPTVVSQQQTITKQNGPPVLQPPHQLQAQSYQQQFNTNNPNQINPYYSENQQQQQQQQQNIMYQNQLAYQQQQQQQQQLKLKQEQEEKKLFEQKRIEQELKEKEIQLKKQELEQREYQFKMQQQQLFLQQQQQQQQAIGQLSINNQHQSPNVNQQQPMLPQTVGQLPNSVPNTILNNNIQQQQQFYSQQQPILNSTVGQLPNTVQNPKTNNIQQQQQQQQFYSQNNAMGQIPNSIQNPQPNNSQYQQNQQYQQIGQLPNSSQPNPMLNTIQHQLQTIGQIMPNNNFQSQQAQLYQQPNQSINKPTLPNQTEQTNNNLDKNIKPDSVYKPGYLNQLKDLPLVVAPPVVSNIQSFNAPIGNNLHQPQFQPKILTNHQPVIGAVNPPIQQQQPAVLNPIQPNHTTTTTLKSTAIDDLFDLFDGRNNQIFFPTLQPIKQQPVDNKPPSEAIVESNQSNESNNPEPIRQQKEEVEQPQQQQPVIKPPESIKISSSSNSSISSVSSPTTPSSANIINPSKKLNFLSNSTKLVDKFLNEATRFENHIHSLNKKTLANGATLLEKEWKELNDYQEKQSSHLTISIARCYPNKNRYQDLLPYDQTRVCLQNNAITNNNKLNSDDYINATLIGQLNSASAAAEFAADHHNPHFIITQAPLQNEIYNFWLMIMEQQIELIVCLCRDSELNNSQCYWPLDKQTALNINSLKISLLSFKQTSHSIQRICSVKNSNDNQTRTCVLLQYNQNNLISATTPEQMPENVASFLKFIKECEHFYRKEQRMPSHPILVHCLNGVSRSAVFILLYNMIQIIDLNCDANLSINLSDLLIRFIKQMRSKRKYMIQSVYHLKYSYDAILYYLKDMLIKEGILNNNNAITIDENENNNNQNSDRKGSVEINSNILNDESLISIQSSNEPIVTKINSSYSPNNNNNNNNIEKFSPTAPNVKSTELNILDLCDPDKFSINLNDDSPKRKQKFTKKDFLSPNSTKQHQQQYDPFRSLDPLAK